MTAKIGYVWHLRRLMADRGMYATTKLGPHLAKRGITLSREQIYRLVTGTPERLNLAVLVALCDILDCQPGDLIEPVIPAVKAKNTLTRTTGALDAATRPRPRRARVLPGPEQ
jgi:DNA-binding Xre family transcriptional regulator